MKKMKGLTLFELLAVIVVIAIVMVVAIPIITGVIEKANQETAKSSALGYIEGINDNNVLSELSGSHVKIEYGD